MKACKAQKGEELKKKEDNEDPPSSIAQLSPLPPPHNYQHGQGYYENQGYWGQPPMPDSYARHAGYDNQSQCYHPSGFRCRRGGYCG